jgi:alkylhydroperoxidase/carboxymuconolactone decarboxylase family protein YurZ
MIGLYVVLALLAIAYMISSTRRQIAGETAPPGVTDEEIAHAITVAIGYGPVPLSIRDHPEITAEYRTAADRDRLVRDISAAVERLLDERHLR